MTINRITCKFVLPYIVQPEGSFTFNYGDEVFDIDIKHNNIPALHQIITGFKYNPDKPVGISGPQEIFKGISQVQISLPVSSQDFSQLDDTEIRNRIAGILNEYQYCYLYISGKSWSNSISADHFVNMRFLTSRIQGMSSNWGGSHRKIPQFQDDKTAIPDFSKYLSEDERIPIPYVFLIDARKHYISGEYHLMYVEIAISFENLVERSYKKISEVYERKMFKEGKLEGKISHLLNQYCKWDKDKIEEIVDICDRRNQVVHHNRRNFPHEEAYEHLIVGEEAIRTIIEWISS